MMPLHYVRCRVRTSMRTFRRAAPPTALACVFRAALLVCCKALRAELRRARNAEAAWNNKPESTNEPTCRPVNQLSPAHFQSALQFCSRCERRWHNPAASRTQGAAKDTGTRAAAHVRRRCHFLTHARPPARAKQTHTKPE